MDHTLREVSKQFEDGLITSLEFRNKFVIRLCEIENQKNLEALAHAVADFDDGGT